MPKFLTALLITTACLLGGCSNLEFPGVYKLTIEQGNVVTQEMVDQLKPGMSQEQVEFIMGSPLLKDPFNTDRWDYLYSVERGDEPREQYRLSVYFEAGRLKSFSGDFLPSSAKPAATALQPPEQAG